MRGKKLSNTGTGRTFAHVKKMGSLSDLALSGALTVCPQKMGFVALFLDGARAQEDFVGIVRHLRFLSNRDKAAVVSLVSGEFSSAVGHIGNHRVAWIPAEEEDSERLAEYWAHPSDVAARRYLGGFGARFLTWTIPARALPPCILLGGSVESLPRPSSSFFRLMGSVQHLEAARARWVEEWRRTHDAPPPPPSCDWTIFE